MTDEELDELVADCPRLYHMAQAGSWTSIRERGLLSTSALLDLYKVPGDARAAIERARRAESITIERDGFPSAVIRDNKPMDDAGLRRALPPEISPTDWYALLNGKVFFWLTEDRLNRLMKAGPYRDHEHDVLVLRTSDLIADYRTKIWLCPINSGCTKPMPHPRDYSTFCRIVDYPYSAYRAKRKRGERVVELCVDGGVFDIEMYIERVQRMKAGVVLSTEFPEEPKPA